MPHRPQTICHSDRNRIIRFLNDSGEHVEERPVMPALSPVEGAASNGQEGSSELQLVAGSYPLKTTNGGPASSVEVRNG